MYKKLRNSELGRPNIEAFKKQKKNPIVIILDNVRSLHNIGSIFRTADAFAVEKIFLCGITAQPPHREINKTALGATESMEWEYYPKTEDALYQLKEIGYEVFVVEQTTNSLKLDQFQSNPKQKIALIFGHEVNGVAQKIVNLADQVIEIPQSGTKHSLNISVSVGIILWETYKNMLSK